MSKLRSDELVNMEGDGAPSFPQGATSIEPTADNQVATKLYVDSALSAAAGNAVSSTAPTNPAIGSFWTDTSVSPSLLKTWNGSMWIEFAGTAGAAVGVVVSLPSLSATNLEYAPATITAAAAQVSNATLYITKWYKDDVEIVGATGSTYVATEPGVYRYEERWADNAGNVLTPSLNKTIQVLAIETPSITSPVVDSGVPDYVYEAASSAIANVDSVEVTGPGVGSPIVYDSNLSTSAAGAVYDSSNQRVVVMYYNADGSGDNASGRAVVGTVSGTSISFGSPSTFYFGSATDFSLAYDSTNQKVVACYRNFSNSNYGTAIVGTVNPSNNTISFGSSVVFKSTATYGISATYDSTNQKVVVAYKDGNQHEGHVRVGTVSGTSISFGSEVTFSDSASFLSSTFDSSNGKVVIAYSDGGNSGYGTAIVGTVSGTSISFGTPVVFESAESQWITSTYDSTNEKVVIAYRDNGNSYYGTAVVGTVSGTSISFGTPVVFESANIDYISATYDSTNDKVAVVYKNYGNSNYGTAAVGTVSGTSISFGTPVVFESGSTSYNSAIFDSSTGKVVVAYTDVSNTQKATSVVLSTTGASIPQLGSPTVFESARSEYIAAVYDPNNQKVVIAYRDDGNSQYGTAIIGTVSGNSISFGSPVVFNYARTDYNSVVYDTANQKVVIAYSDSGNSTYGTAIVGTVSGDSISFGSEATFETSGSSYISSVYDPDNQKVVIAYQNSSLKGKAVIGTVSGTSISFGSGVEFSSGNNILYTTVAYDTANDKVVIAYTDNGNSAYGKAVVGTVSGTSISFGSPVTFHSDETTDMSSEYDPINQKVIIAYRDQGMTGVWHGKAIVGTVSGTSISFGSEATFEYGEVYDLTVMYIDQRIVITYRDVDRDHYGTVVEGTVSGTSISFGSAAVFQHSRAQNLEATLYDPDSKKIVSSFTDYGNSLYGTTVVFSPASTATQLTLTDTTVSKVSDGTLIEGTTIDEVLTVGETVQASSDAGVSGTISASSGNTITLSNTTGTWSTGMKVHGVTTDTKDNPDPIDASAVTFASSEPVVTSGTVSAWDYAEWNLSYDAQFSSVVHEKAVPLTATGTQAGPDSFPIQAGTEYFVRTKYASFLPSGQSDWSAVTRFLTKAIVYADDVFSTYLYEGNGSTQSINNGIDLSGEGGLVWIKNRDTSAYNHCLFDTERGATKFLLSNSSGGQYTNTNSLTGFNSDGFDLGSYGDVNANTLDICSWTFRKAPGFFDVVTYTGNGSVRTISHNLGSVPGMILIKMTSSSDSWVVYHRSTGATHYLSLNSDGAAVDNDSRFNDTEPTASVFTVGTDNGVNQSGQTFVAYLFAHDDARFGTNSDEAIIKCGSFTGNTASVDLGFEPQWVMFKRTDSSTGGSWHMYDTMRGFHAPDADDALLYADRTNAESVASRRINLTSTGFDQTTNLYSGATYIYMAIRRPHKPPEAGTDVFAVDTFTGSTPNYISDFVVDFAINRNQISISGNDQYMGTRLQGGKFLKSNTTDAELGATAATYDFMDGWSSDSGSATSEKYSWMFKRAPGFMDVVAYTGNGSAGRTVDHNLTVVPEMMIVKRRNQSAGWNIYHETNGNTKKHYFSSGASFTSTDTWNSTSPTAQNFTLGTNIEVNGSGDAYIAYLFATLDGISKVGSYTGTGSNINVDCGFIAGARFVLIKRTDSTGDWYVWDTTRGIVSGNDPYLLLNTTDAQVTNTDYIDPLNAGFTVTSSAPAALNASGGTYLFLAIA